MDETQISTQKFQVKKRKTWTETNILELYLDKYAEGTRTIQCHKLQWLLRLLAVLKPLFVLQNPQSTVTVLFQPPCTHPHYCQRSSWGWTCPGVPQDSKPEKWLMNTAVAVLLTSHPQKDQIVQAYTNVSLCFHFLILFLPTKHTEIFAVIFLNMLSWLLRTPMLSTPSILLFEQFYTKSRQTNSERQTCERYGKLSLFSVSVNKRRYSGLICLS